MYESQTKKIKENPSGMKVFQRDFREFGGMKAVEVKIVRK